MAITVEELLKRDHVMLDGGFGTELQKRGMKPGETSEMMNFVRADDVYAIHRSYIEAGADIINANTFGANRLKLAKSGRSVTETVGKALSIARRAAEGTDALVSLDIGPTGQLLEPAGTLSFEEAYDIFREIVEAGRDQADLICIETMTDLYEIKAAMLAAKECSDLPVFAFMSFEKNGRTFTGCLPSAMALTLTGLGADAVGVNCSLAPDELYDIVREITEYTDLPVIVKANAGLPDPATGAYSVPAEQYVGDCVKYTEMGVKVYGGCCGTTPEYIRGLKAMLASHAPAVRGTGKRGACVCSYSRTVRIDEPKIIGERINPTGKKLFKEALRNNDIKICKLSKTKTPERKSLMTKTYNKLVRDRIPEIIQSAGKSCTTEVLSDEDYLRMIDIKLDEELAEYHESGSIEELADLLEVIYAAACARGTSPEELEAVRVKKSEASRFSGYYHDGIILIIPFFRNKSQPEGCHLTSRIKQNLRPVAFFHVSCLFIKINFVKCFVFCLDFHSADFQFCLDPLIKSNICCNTFNIIGTPGQLIPVGQKHLLFNGEIRRLLTADRCLLQKSVSVWFYPKTYNPPFH